MPLPDNIAFFIAASVLLIVTPGQDLYLVMARSLAQGPRAGIVTAAGVGTGLLGHTLLVGLGVGALIRASDVLFLGLRLAGAAYLIWLGASLLKSSRGGFAAASGAPLSLSRLYLQGALSNLMNPKIAVFYLAFLPQFVPADTSSPTTMLFFLGALFAAMTFAIKAPIGCAAGMLSAVFRRHPPIRRWMDRFSAAVLILLGLKLAVERTV